jgi:hypothetical protein
LPLLRSVDFFAYQYLVLAAETAPFLYEVEEDDDEVRCCYDCCLYSSSHSSHTLFLQAVEALAQRIVKNLEAMLGESLQDYSS